MELNICSFGWEDFKRLMGGLLELLPKTICLYLTDYNTTKLREENKELKKSMVEQENAFREKENQLKEKELKLSKDVVELRQKMHWSERRLEIQRNDLIEQSFSVYELYFTLKMAKGEVCLEIANKLSRPVMILRKHQRNLIFLTKPHINHIITSASAAGIVSKTIGECAETCSIPNHDCTQGFYKALLVSVDNSADMLERFLRLVMEEVDSVPCRSLCKRMLQELNFSSQ